MSSSLMSTKRKVRKIALFVGLLCLLLYFGVFTHLFESDFESNFHYPYDGDIEEFVQQLRNNITPNVQPINSYNFEFLKSCHDKCKGVDSLRLVYLVKSAPEHFDRRATIRSSWGYEHRFSDVEIRRVFLVGLRNNSKLLRKLDVESHQFGDIVQANFTDDYYNNTLKTMAGFTWVAKFCPHSRFYMFVDDDYYVSTKNLLRFVRNPVKYPENLKKLSERRSRKINQFDFDLDDTVRLYAGYAFRSAPLRHFSSKWYVSLEEYPYNKWPPYITAGAYVLSREALLNMYFASFYTKHFRFDDIYVALLAYKCKIEPFHCDEFYFHKKPYSSNGYEFVIASHGYDEPSELLDVWTQQRSLGHA